MPDVSLITCTADRPAAFALCERWMARQTFAGSVEWIVADGGETPVACTRGQTHLRVGPCSDPRMNFRRNLLAGLDRATAPIVIPVEDDDWYSPHYVAGVVARFDRLDLIGEAGAKYYNLATRRYRRCGNKSHASLCQTAMSRPMALWLAGEISRVRGAFVDLHLWVDAPTKRKYLSPTSTYVVGMKGLPGKSGIGIGHRMDVRFPVDADGSVLRSWVGAEDAAIYDELALQPVS